MPTAMHEFIDIIREAMMSHCLWLNAFSYTTDRSNR